MMKRFRSLCSLITATALLAAGLGLLSEPAGAQDLFANFEADLPGVIGTSSIGDVNGDGAADVLLAGRKELDGPKVAKVFLGHGTGGFREARAGLIGVSLNPSSSIADVNEDGHADLLITGNKGTGNGIENIEPSSTLYLGNGEGGFSEAGARLTNLTYGSSSIADVNEDGHLDLLLAGETRISGSDDFEKLTLLYLGDGSGGFTNAEAGLIGVVDASTSIADLNGDGHMDLLLTGENAYNLVAKVYLGDGQGGFTEAKAGLTGVDRPGTDIGDVNEDGNPDLLITGKGVNKTTTVYLGDGAGGFTEAETDLPGVSRGPVSLEDLDGDGHLDVVLTGTTGGFPRETIARVYLGDGTGHFTQAQAGLSGLTNGTVSVANINGDRAPDLLLTGKDPNNEFHAVAYENLWEGPTPTAAEQQEVSSDGTVGFGQTGVDIAFSGTNGSGTVTVGKFDCAPADRGGITESNVSNYHFEIEARGNLTFGSGTEIRLDVSSLGGIGDASNVTIYKRAAAEARSFRALETTYDAEAGELVANVDRFSTFALGSDSEPLPVELAQFEAEIDEGQVLLRWQTASETGNAGFEVQRRAVHESGMREDWATIRFVEGAGTTTDPEGFRDYRFTDADLPYGAELLSYRLRQVDTDGTANYSENVTVRRDVQEVQLPGPFPNPARTQATLRYALPNRQHVTISLHNVLGRQVRTVVEGKRNGRQERHLDVSGLASGTYFVCLTSGGQTRTRRLTVVR